MTLGEELKFFAKVATPEDITIMFSESISSENFERIGFILYSLGLKHLQQDFFGKNTLKFLGTINWEAELKKTDIEKYISWLQDFLDHIEDTTEHEKVRQLFELEG